jgi:hypothetical protein
MVNRRVNQALDDPNCLRSLTKPFFFRSLDGAPFRGLFLPEDGSMLDVTLPRPLLHPQKLENDQIKLANLKDDDSIQSLAPTKMGN